MGDSGVDREREREKRERERATERGTAGERDGGWKVKMQGTHTPRK